MIGAIISFIVYIAIISLLIFYKILVMIFSFKYKIGDNIHIGLTEYQFNYLIISSILYLLLFYFLKSFIIDINMDYILIIGILYIIWYFLTKIISNLVSKSNDTI
tara:strand:+ start:429 stop:743 length:315 start_codon:yes stop_codon:yes gene_type:complete